MSPTTLELDHFDDLVFIGDIHGQFPEYLAIQSGLRPKAVGIQVGDLGLGFPDSPDLELPGRARFIRGNHDNPGTCRATPGYMGEYGVYGVRLKGHEFNMFFAGGAYSIDRAWRVPGVSWWPDEELTNDQMKDASRLYEEAKPLLVVTHDCPTSVSPLCRVPGMEDQIQKSNATNLFLQELYGIHAPNIWVHGHYHITDTRMDRGTLFACVGELRAVTLGTLAVRRGLGLPDDL